MGLRGLFTYTVELLSKMLNCERGNPKMYRPQIITILLILLTVFVTIIVCMVLLYRILLQKEQQNRGPSNLITNSTSAITGDQSKEIAMQGVQHVYAYIIIWV